MDAFRPPLARHVFGNDLFGLFQTVISVQLSRKLDALDHPHGRYLEIKVTILRLRCLIDRKKRIAKGCGLQIQDVNRLLNQYEQSRKLMKQLGGGRGGKKRRGMGGFKLPF